MWKEMWERLTGQPAPPATAQDQGPDAELAQLRELAARTAAMADAQDALAAETLEYYDKRLEAITGEGS